MLSVAEALEIVLSKCRPLPSCAMPLTPTTLGSVLAEDVASDLDMPPFDKALMDGYAIRCLDLTDGTATLPIQAEVTAGQTAPPLLPGNAIRIMTGAPIPSGADAVIRVEDTKMVAEDCVEIRTKPPKPGQFILERGREMKRGEVVLSTGSVLLPQELGLLATVGRTAVKTIPSPIVAILPTGDELVEAGQTPGPGQLRNSNGPMLAAQTARAGASPRLLGIARDDANSMQAMIREGLESEILILSGGVSMGTKDLVPGVLQDLGVQPHFHHVAMKPGKPLFFGTRGETLVFGLAGNPVSSFCSFELFVRPAIRKMAGHASPDSARQEAMLHEDFAHNSERPTYHPAKVENVGGVNRVKIVPWFGSPDLRALTQANALLVLPGGKHTFAAGQKMSVLLLN
jgi:molybdopterin molybdotransferase